MAAVRCDRQSSAAEVVYEAEATGFAAALAATVVGG